MSMMKQFRSFRKSENGAVAPLAALMFLVIAGAAGIAIDYAYWASERARLQAAVDAAAIAAATDKSLTQAEAEVDVTAFMDAHGMPASGDLVYTTTVTGMEVEVVATANVERFFTGMYASGDQRITVNATALSEVEEPACMVTLNDAVPGALTLAGGAQVSAPNCGVFVNSVDADSAIVNGTVATLTSPNTCLVGGIGAGASQIDAAPQTGCTPRRDPMDGFVPAALPADVEDPGGCTTQTVPAGNSDFSLIPTTNTDGSTNTDATAGVFCGGIFITGNFRRDITLEPGIYVIKDGPFTVTGGNLTGLGVTFHFVGDPTTTVNMTGNGDVHLTPPTSGPFEGILMYGDPNYPDMEGTGATISGGADLHYEGVIYFPNQDLTVVGNGSVGSNVSPYTSYIANTLAFTGATDFEVNGDPDAVAYNLPPGFDGETKVSMIK